MQNCWLFGKQTIRGSRQGPNNHDFIAQSISGKEKKTFLRSFFSLSTDAFANHCNNRTKGTGWKDSWNEWNGKNLSLLRWVNLYRKIDSVCLEGNKEQFIPLTFVGSHRQDILFLLKSINQFKRFIQLDSYWFYCSPI